MSGDATVATLHTVTGAGVLARRDLDLLFLPERHDAVLEAYRQADPREVIEAVSSQAEGHPDAAFVVVTWNGAVRLALYGDVEVTSDHRSLPRLNAAGTGTWIERSVRTGAIVLGVRPEQSDAVTSLDRGTIFAGGFALNLQGVDRPPDAAAHHRASGPDHAPDAPAVSTPAPVDPAPAAAAQAPLAEPVKQARAADPPTPNAPIAPTSPPGRGDDLSAARADTSATSEPLGVHASAAPSPPTTARATDGVLSDQPAPPADLSSLMDAVLDASDPTIDVPDSLLADRSRTGASWRIRFVNGNTEYVDRDLVLGRQPGEPADARAITVDCQKVSSQHLRLATDGDRILATDLNSRNKSWLVSTGDQSLIQLVPGEATELKHGSHLQIGTRVFVVERADDTDN